MREAMRGYRCYSVERAASLNVAAPTDAPGANSSGGRSEARLEVPSGDLSVPGLGEDFHLLGLSADLAFQDHDTTNLVVTNLTDGRHEDTRTFCAFARAVHRVDPAGTYTTALELMFASSTYTTALELMFASSFRATSPAYYSIRLRLEIVADGVFNPTGFELGTSAKELGKVRKSIAKQAGVSESKVTFSTSANFPRVELCNQIDSCKIEVNIQAETPSQKTDPKRWVSELAGAISNGTFLDTMFKQEFVASDTMFKQEFVASVALTHYPFLQPDVNKDQACPAPPRRRISQVHGEWTRAIDERALDVGSAPFGFKACAALALVVW
ncbi:hypothetical protein T484DRAFT_1763647 [Baffinella frigidus]|nr:hypothetical protein T484DRAFT_1763647 [Cryptophyta sp. CCMP2293]